MALLESEGVLATLDWIEPKLADHEQLARVHSSHLIDRVHSVSALGGGNLDADTYSTAASFEQACLAAGTVSGIVDDVMSGKAANGLALIRPPGHHAEEGKVGGFCLFNNVAIGARQAQVVHQAERIVIIDYDVHHGNGTQAIFYEDPSVLFISLHMYHPFFYPGSGGLNEIGAGPGKGTTLNVPFEPGAGDQCYSRAYNEVIKPRIELFSPDLVLVSAGFDAHWADPLAAASLSLTGYAELTQNIVELAASLCQDRLILVLEGGYHLQALSFGVLNTVHALTGLETIDDPLGEANIPEPNITNLLSKLQLLHLPS
jgi:acetoin utilization deacetylase AcuC-like enzyme